MEFNLKKLRKDKNIPAKDMVEVIKAIYPKYDKTVQSKCENGAVYGVLLRPDAVDAICERFAPELKQGKKKNDHRLKCRISCRLEDDEYEALQLNIQADGYTTMQDWLTAIVQDYNRRKKEA